MTTPGAYRSNVTAVWNIFSEAVLATYGSRAGSAKVLTSAASRSESTQKAAGVLWLVALRGGPTRHAGR